MTRAYQALTNGTQILFVLCVAAYSVAAGALAMELADDGHAQPLPLSRQVAADSAFTAEIVQPRWSGAAEANLAFAPAPRADPAPAPIHQPVERFSGEGGRAQDGTSTSTDRRAYLLDTSIIFHQRGWIGRESDRDTWIGFDRLETRSNAR